MPRTILLADDSVTIQKVVELTFMDEDYEVVAVSSGDEALERLEEVQPDLVIADVHMPGASGYELCRRVKEERSGVPVLLLVGTFEPFDAEEAASCGADGHLKKPFDSQELLRLVGELAGADEAPPAAQGAGEEESSEVGPMEAPPIWGNLDLEGAEEALAQGEEEEPPAASHTGHEGGGPEAVTGGGDELEETRPEVRRAEPVRDAEPASPSGGDLTERDLDRIARRVVEILSEKIVREVAWEVLPDLAEVIIKDRLRELEGQVEGD